MSAEPEFGPLAAFDRLDCASRAPIAVAVSGGGDSLYALIATCRWARRHGRPVLALCVDHQLQPQSAEWTAFAGGGAARLGAAFRPLVWSDAKPATGLPAAARAARHRLLADAARAAGCRVIVTGHTADDALENALLGQGAISEWSASPAWPAGRDISLLRPLLRLRRAQVRLELSQAGWSWIDDPANEDPLSPRVRARAKVASENTSAPCLVPTARTAHHVTIDPAGAITGPCSAFDPAILAMAAVCAGGGARMPRGDETERLHARLRSGQAFAATLARARVAADSGKVVITREPGRELIPPLDLTPGATTTWDGRFELQSERPGYRVTALDGYAARLPKAQLPALRRIAAQARGRLPALVRPDGTVVCPILAEENGVRCRGLVNGRFLAAIGAIGDERSACDFVRMAKWAQNPYLGGLGLRGEVHESA